MKVNFLKIILLLFVVKFYGVGDGFAVEIKAEISRDKIYLGESFILKLSLNGCSELGNVSFENEKDCTIRPLGSQKYSNYSVSIINGKVARQEFSGIVANYEITPNKAGTFNLGKIIIEADGKKYSITIDSITVTDIEKQDVVKIIISASQETALIDEPFEITLSLLIKRLSGNMAHLDPIYSDNPPHLSIPWLDDPKIAALKGPDIQALLNQLLVQKKDQSGIYINNYTVRTDPFADPFDFSSFFEPKRAKFVLPRKIVETNGVSYFEYSIKFKYSSKEEGNFVFGPVVFKGDVPVTISENNVSPFRVFAVGRAATVRVTPPPEKERPASFIGAIGSNMFLKATLDVSECFLGDPIKLTLTITGDIRFDKIFPPFLTNQTALVELFTIYEDSLKIERGEKSIQFIYTMRPKKEGSYCVPPIEMAYFDTTSRSYKKVFSEELPIIVKHSEQITASQIIASSNVYQMAETEKKDPKLLPVCPIKIDSEGIIDTSFVPEKIWLAGIVCGPLAYFSIILFQTFIGYTKRLSKIKIKQNSYYKAMKECKRIGTRSNLTLREQSHILCKIITTFLAERLNIKTDGITPEELKTLLKNLNLPKEATDELVAIFTKNFNNAFSNLQEIKQISEFEEDKKKVLKILKIIKDITA